MSTSTSKKTKTLIALFFAVLLAFTTVQGSADASVSISADKKGKILYGTLTPKVLGDSGHYTDPSVTIQKRNVVFIYTNVVTMKGLGAYYFYSGKPGTYRARGKYKIPDNVFFQTKTATSSSISV